MEQLFFRPSAEIFLLKNKGGVAKGGGGVVARNGTDVSLRQNETVSARNERIRIVPFQNIKKT